MDKHRNYRDFRMGGHGLRPDDCFYIDFHVHTIYSHDSFNGFDIFLRAQKKNYHIAITDHDSVKGIQVGRKLGLKFIPGIEITTDRGDLIGLFADFSDPKRFYKRMDFYEALDKIKEDGGISVCPHPFDVLRRKAIRDEKVISACDAVEGYNSRTIFEGTSVRAMKFALAHGKPITVGSDAHFPIELWNSYMKFTDERVFDDPKVLLKELKKRPEYHVQQTFMFAPALTFVLKHVYKRIAPDRRL